MITTLFEQLIVLGIFLNYFKLASHGDETWYACILHRFHYNLNNKWPKAFFLITSNLLTVARREMELDAYAYYIISMTIMLHEHFSSLLTLEGLLPFTEIYVVVIYKNVWMHV